MRSAHAQALVFDEESHGRGGLASIQRARMVTATVEVVRERGLGRTTVSHIVARSGVSRRTFYELFSDRDECVLAAFEESVRRAAARVVPAYESGASWSERIRAGLGELLRFLEGEPALAAFCVIDALGAGPAALARRAAIVEVLVDAVHEGRHGAKNPAKLTPLMAEGVVGAVLGVLHARLAEGPVVPGRPRCLANVRKGVPLVELLGPLMGIVVLPYRGAAVSAREAARCAPHHRPAAPAQRDPLRDLEMRLTYRTVRVLLAIADNPGASNRRIANVAGVSDQGQISKLLSRLEHLGLSQNHCRLPARGEPNAWHLSPRGQEVERAVRRRDAPVASG